jgi:hypothetical protein
MTVAWSCFLLLLPAPNAPANLVHNGGLEAETRFVVRQTP